MPSTNAFLTPPPATMLATTDPAAATDSYNILEDSFAAFVRTSRNRLPSVSPRMHPLYNPSPRLPSALPPSASPRVEPLTPDLPNAAIPFYSADDAVDLPSPTPQQKSREQAREAERARRVEWGRNLPSLPRRGMGVVDEDAADRIFSSVPRRQSRPMRSPPVALSAPEPVRPEETPMHPAMKLELAPLRGTAPPPVLSPSAWGLPSPLNKTSTTPRDFWARPDIEKPASPREMWMRAMGPEKNERDVWAKMMEGGPVVPGSVEVEKKEELWGRQHRPDVMKPTLDLFGRDLPDLQVAPRGGGSSSTITEEGNRRRPRAAPDVMVECSPVKAMSADPLRCHLCHQRFARRSNLFKHLRSVHEETRKFACNVCPFKFKRQDHLLKHQRSVHAKVRKFACEICGIGFAEKFNRDKHTRSIHFTRRAFQCPCGAYFQDRDKMLACLRCKSAAV